MNMKRLYVTDTNLPCSRLQATSVHIGESFPIPEIVAIGGQSDGKSSLLEAFLGVSVEVTVLLAQLGS